MPASGVGSVTVNVTVQHPGAGGYLHGLRGGSGATHGTSCLNFLAGETRANRVTVALGSAGTIELYVGSSGSANLIVDVQGYTLSGTGTTAGAYVPVTLTRVLDTRSGAQLKAGAQTGISAGPVPYDRAEAVVLNVTVTNPTHSGYISTGPKDYAPATTSSVNFLVARSTAGQVVVPVDPSGVGLVNRGSGSIDLVVDVEGYLVAPSMTWTKRSPQIDPLHGTLNLASCPTTSWCARLGLLQRILHRHSRHLERGRQRRPGRRIRVAMPLPDPLRGPGLG